MCKGYNGYENYQSWVVSLWLDNSQGDYEYYMERARDLLYMHDEDGAHFRLADEIKENLEEGSPTASAASVYSDLLGYALGSVNWYEVASSLIETALEELEAEEEEPCGQ